MLVTKFLFQAPDSPNEPNDENLVTVESHQSVPLSLPLCAAALGHQSDKDPCHLHPAVRAVRLPALRRTASNYL